VLGGNARRQGLTGFDRLRRAAIGHRLFDGAEQLLLERGDQADGLDAQLLRIGRRGRLGAEGKQAESEQRQGFHGTYAGCFV